MLASVGLGFTADISEKLEVCLHRYGKLSQYLTKTQEICFRIKGVAEHEGNTSQKLFVMVVDWKRLMMRVKQAVGRNVKISPSHMELPL
jgi:hypothetical protein